MAKQELSEQQKNLVDYLLNELNGRGFYENGEDEGDGRIFMYGNHVYIDLYFERGNYDIEPEKISPFTIENLELLLAEMVKENFKPNSFVFLDFEEDNVAIITLVDPEITTHSDSNTFIHSGFGKLVVITD